MAPVAIRGSGLDTTSRTTEEMHESNGMTKKFEASHRYHTRHCGDGLRVWQGDQRDVNLIGAVGPLSGARPRRRGF